MKNLIETLKASKTPFRANDNISSQLTEADIQVIQNNVEKAVDGVLEALIIDIENDHNTKETSKRIAKMLVREVFSGRYQSMPRVTDFPNAKKLDDMLIVGPINVRSTCSHHFAPILGNCWIGVIPSERVIGISKFSRVANWIFSRPQIQEEMAVQLADTLEALMKPKGIAIVIRASHTCMSWRGVKETASKMQTSIMRGVFRDNHSARQEFLELVK